MRPAAQLAAGVFDCRRGLSGERQFASRLASESGFTDRCPVQDMALPPEGPGTGNPKRAWAYGRSHPFQARGSRSFKVGRTHAEGTPHTLSRT